MSVCLFVWKCVIYSPSPSLSLTSPLPSSILWFPKLFYQLKKHLFRFLAINQCARLSLSAFLSLFLFFLCRSSRLLVLREKVSSLPICCWNLSVSATTFPLFDKIALSREWVHVCRRVVRCRSIRDSQQQLRKLKFYPSSLSFASVCVRILLFVFFGVARLLFRQKFRKKNLTLNSVRFFFFVFALQTSMEGSFCSNFIIISFFSASVFAHRKSLNFSSKSEWKI